MSIKDEIKHEIDELYGEPDGSSISEATKEIAKSFADLFHDDVAIPASIFSMATNL